MSNRFSTLVAILAVTGFYFPVFNGTRLILWDTYEYSYPIALFLRDSIQSGILPMWNPFILSGDPIFAHPAVSAYHPFNLIVALAPSSLNSFTLYQILTAACPLVGATGVIFLSRMAGLSHLSAAIIGSTYGIAAFGPLLGQVAVSFSTALFPWTAAAAIFLFSETRFSTHKSILLGAVAALQFWGGYFGSILYSVCAIAIILAVHFVRAKPPARSSIINFGLSAFVFFTLTAPHIYAVIENRNFYFTNIRKDFLTPDPRVRGISLHESQVVEVIPNERTLIGILLNDRDMASDGAFWVLGPGYLMLGLLIISLTQLRRSSWLINSWVLLILGTSYLLGPKSLVFDFVFEFIPLLNGIRYPVFFYPFFLLLVALIGSITFDQLTQHLSVRVRWALVLLVVIETMVFGFSSDLYKDRVPHILKSVDTNELLSLSLANRSEQVSVKTNLRSMRQSEEIIFFDKKWIVEKSLSNHGYSTADTPAYWYLKDAKILSQIAYCPTESVIFNMPVRLGNKEFEKIGEVAHTLESSSVLLERSTKNLGGCDIEEVRVSPNEISIRLKSSIDTLLVVNSKYYPGWRADVDGVPAQIFKANILFSAVLIPGMSAPQIVTLKFEPLSYLILLWITLPSAALYSFWVGFQIIRKSKKLV